jgi:hypothetical protein
VFVESYLAGTSSRLVDETTYRAGC